MAAGFSNAIFWFGGCMSKYDLDSLGWIPVKSRLPQSALVKVLITNGKYVCVSKARILVAHPDVATHWMPLARTSVIHRKSGRVS